MSIGKVWLVGAGPGDPGLLTCRGREALEHATVVVYDRLAGDGVLALIPPEAKCIDVGKSGGAHPVPQRGIEDILVREALAGERVVRLKGGDPFLFGRGGEEIEALLAHDIPYEVVPGVSSAIAAPECAGIPVTHRGLANSLHIITAHTKEGGIAEQDYAALARLGGTLVFLMGVSAVPEICDRLQTQGFSPSTPIAAVEWGTTAHQRTLTGTLAYFDRKAVAFGLRSPSVIIVGAVADLAERFSWRETMPLCGKKVIVTRPRDRIGTVSQKLRALGAEVIELPTIATEPLGSPLPSLEGYDWLGFTSAAGVDYFFAALEREGRDVRSIGRAQLAAIGPATAMALRSRGLCVSLVPAVYDGAHLADELAQKANGAPILLLRAQDGSPELSERLRTAGANFAEHALYRTRLLKAPFQPREADAVLFTSASTVRGFCAACPQLNVPLACCIGTQTAEAARNCGFTNIRVARRATLDDLIDTLKESEQQ